MDPKDILKELLKKDDDNIDEVDDRLNQCPVCNKNYCISTNSIPQAFTCINKHTWYKMKDNDKLLQMYKNTETGAVTYILYK